MELLHQYDRIFGGRFVILNRLGGGGQSFTFIGLDNQAPPKRPWKKTVFIKQYRDIRPGTQKAIALQDHFQVLRERLKNKSYYLCRPIHLGEENGSVIGVFEYVHGKSLEDWMRDGLSQNQRVRLAYAITNAIRILHSAGVVHLDLKPGNILVEEKKGQLYARIIDIDAAQIDGVGLRSKVYGTMNYMSPEHVAPDHYGCVSDRSDVFALGIIIFQLLFNKYPFFGDDYWSAVQNGDIEVPENRYHRDVVERIVKCLETDPQRRPKAGWVHSTLHKHRNNNFEAYEEKDRWLSVYVSLSSGAFQRSYYYGTHLGREHFLGSGIVGLPPIFLCLYLTTKGVSIELTDEEVDVFVLEGRLHSFKANLPKGYRKPLRTGNILTIKGKQFAVTVGM